MPSRASGLLQPYVAERKRTVDARHEDPAWLCVQILEDTANPRWRCLGCGMNRSGGATKVVDHLLGLNRSLICNYAIGDEAFKSNLEKVKKSQGNKEQKKAQKDAVAAVNKAATNSSIGGVVVQHHQSIAVSFSHNQADNCDAAIAEFFFACNIPASVVDHAKFKALVATLKAAPAFRINSSKNVGHPPAAQPRPPRHGPPR